MLINVPWVMCNMLQCTGVPERAKPDPCGPGAMGARFPAAPGARGGMCVGEKEGLVAPPCSDMIYPDFPQSSAIWLIFHAGCPTHAAFFPQEIPARTVNTLPSTRMKNMLLFPLNSSYLLLRGFVVRAQIFWNKALKSVGKVVSGPGSVLDFPSDSRQLWAKPALPTALGGRTCADAPGRPPAPSCCNPPGTRSRHLRGEQGPGSPGA